MSAVEDLALKSLMDSVDGDDTARLRNSIPKRLREHFAGYRIVVTILDGNDDIGVAAMSPLDKQPVTMMGSKDAFLKDFNARFIDMCDVLEAKLKATERKKA